MSTALSNYSSEPNAHLPDIIKKYIVKNAKRLYSDRFPVAVEPAFVKRYMKTHADIGFCKKEIGHRL